MSDVQSVVPKVVINTTHVRAMLNARFAAPEWALMEEVAPRTGGGTGYADAVAVNLWNSRGHAIHGFEIKVSRSDWLRELKQPAKAESVYQYCDHWWIAAPKGVIKDGELPPTWGLYEVRESGMVQIVAAPKLSPLPITREFFASLVRRSNEGINDRAERMQRTAVERAYAEINARVEKEIKQRSHKLAELQQHLAKLKEETGIEITRFSGPPIETIKLAQRLEFLNQYGRPGALSLLVQLAEDLDRAAKAIHEAVSCSELHAPAAIPQ